MLEEGIDEDARLDLDGGPAFSGPRAPMANELLGRGVLVKDFAREVFDQGVEVGQELLLLSLAHAGLGNLAGKKMGLKKTKNVEMFDVPAIPN